MLKYLIAIVLALNTSPAEAGRFTNQILIAVGVTQTTPTIPVVRKDVHTGRESGAGKVGVLPIAKAPTPAAGHWENRCTMDANGKRSCRRVWVPATLPAGTAPRYSMPQGHERSVMSNSRTPLRHRIRFTPSR